MRIPRRDERGAVAVFTAIVFMSILVGIGALTVDIGSQRVGRRDMQALTDVVSLDMSRLLDGSAKAVIEARPTWTSTRVNSVARNSTTFGSPPVVSAVLGSVDATGTFTALTAAQGAVVPTAVKVTATTRVGFAFGLASGGSATRSSVAIASATTCFKIGSYAARLNTGNSPLLTNILNGALGNIGVTAVGYQGLANSTISLGALSAALGLGGVSQLASGSATVGQVFTAAATVLTQNGDVAGAAALDAIIAQAGTSSTSRLNQTIPLGGLASVATGSGSAVAGSINLLDLVSGTAFVANGMNALAIPGLGTNLGLTGTGLVTTATLTQAASAYCGGLGTTGSSSQSDISVTGQLASVTTPAALNGLSLSVGAGSTAIGVHLAKATGTITNIVCGAGTTSSPEGIDVAVTSGLTSVSLSQVIGLSGTISSPGILGNLLGNLLGLILNVKITGSLTLTATTAPPSTTRTAVLRIPNSPTTFAQGVSTGSGDLGLDVGSITSTGTLKFEASGLLGAITLSAAQNAALNSAVLNALTSSVVNPLVNSINSTLVTPLESLLGLELAGADVYNLAPGPNCQSPALAG